MQSQFAACSNNVFLIWGGYIFILEGRQMGTFILQEIDGHALKVYISSSQELPNII